MQGRISTDSHVRATEVIVNGAHHAHNIQVAAAHGLLLVYAACGGDGGY